MQLVGPEGHDQDDAVLAELADEVGDRLAGRRVGPVQVLDDEDDRFDLGESLEDAEDRVEQARLERLGLRSRVRSTRPAERRNQACEVGARAADHGVEDLGLERPDERPERLDDRPVRDAAVTDVGAAADDDAHPAGRRERGRLRDQARLADTGLARDELVDRRPGHREPSSARPIAASSVARPTSVGLTRRRGIAR